MAERLHSKRTNQLVRCSGWRQRELDVVLSRGENRRIGVLYFVLYWRQLYRAAYTVVAF